MAQHLDEDTRAAVAATLWSAAGTPDDEQRRLLDAIGRHVLGVEGAAGAIDPAGAAAAIDDDGLRRCVVEGLVTLELARHTPDPGLVDRVASYVEALGGAEEQAAARDAVAGARDAVAADYERVHGPPVEEPSLVGADAPEIARRLAPLARCAPGTLGRSFHDFYRRHGFDLPDHPSLAAHDFSHVLAGYEPTPEGEVALQGWLVAATAGRRHFSALLASLLVFEVGIMSVNGIEPRVGVLARPGAAELLADAVARGAAAGVDVDELDHLALVDRDLVELRAELGIPAPVAGPSTFVV